MAVLQQHGRRKPYSAAGIARLPCAVAGCTNKAHAQWQICADDRLFRPICLDHDVELNRMALDWIGFPDADQKLARYRESL